MSYIYVLILTFVQLSGYYLVYLPFSNEISNHERNLLIKSFFIWSLLGTLINLFFFSDGISYRAYKMALYTGWLPYFLIFMAIIREKIPQQIFVLGMYLLWCFMLHSLASIVVKIFYGDMSEALLSMQIVFYMIIFFALLKLERKFFINLLPTPKFFEDEKLKWVISLLPLAIFIGTSITIIEKTFLPTWQEKFSRISLPLFFLLIYRSISAATRQITEKISAEEQNRQLSNKMEALKAQNELIERSQQEIEALRANLEENYCIIDKFLAEGRISEAKSFINQQSELLEATSIPIYCKEPLINAAILINLRRAAELGIKIKQNVDLPDKISTDEDDLAILVNNLLTNAITASLQQKNPLQREISLILRHRGGQNILEVKNRSDLPIKFGQRLGINSLELFAKKYDAFVDFSQENGFMHLTIYWNDYL